MITTSQAVIETFDCSTVNAGPKWNQWIKRLVEIRDNLYHGNLLFPMLLLTIIIVFFLSSNKSYINSHFILPIKCTSSETKINFHINTL